MKRRVYEFMTRDLSAAVEHMTLREVTELLSRRQLVSLPIVNTFNQVIGYITEDMIIRAVFPERLDPDNITISLDKFRQVIKRIGDIGTIEIATIMDPHPVTVQEDTLIADAVDLIINRGLHSISVVRDSLLVGTVTRASLCRFLIDSNKL
ncbi:HPP family protein [Thermoproteota archaeon]